MTLVTNNPQGTPIRYFGPESGVLVQADNEQISQVFTNILRNAVQAINGAEGGDIMVILKDDIHQPEVEISFSDNGPGIPEDVQPKIFLMSFLLGYGKMAKMADGRPCSVTVTGISSHKRLND